MRWLLLVALVGCGGADGVRGTRDWAPGTLKPGAVATSDVSVHGAAVGSVCQAGVTAPAPSMGVAVQCIVSAKDVCTVSVRNGGSSDLSLGLATFYCYVWPD